MRFSMVFSFVLFLSAGSQSFATTMACNDPAYGTSAVFSILNTTGRATFKQTINGETVYALECKLNTAPTEFATENYTCSKNSNNVLQVSWFRDPSNGNLKKALDLKSLTNPAEPILKLRDCKMSLLN